MALGSAEYILSYFMQFFCQVHPAAIPPKQKQLCVDTDSVVAIHSHL